MTKPLKLALAAGFLTALAMPAAAQMADYGTMTCEMWAPLSSAEKIYAANGLQVFVRVSSNHTIAGPATELLDGKTTDEAIAIIDNGCLSKPATTTLIEAVSKN